VKYHFDEQAAQDAVDFFPNFLVHVKGKWAGQPFELLPWEENEVIRPLFGWKRPDGTRRYRMVFIFVPKKNGKSTLCAGIALYLLHMDGEVGAEVYSAAGDKYQAAIVFDLASQMIEQSPELAARSQIFKRSIFVPNWMSKYEVLSSEVGTKHGINAHAVMFDELHVQKTRDLWDTLTSATVAREQPVVVAATTAGWDRESIGREVYNHAKCVYEDPDYDPSFLAVIHEANPDADWTDPRIWEAANPSYGITIPEVNFEEECARAVKIPGKQNAFRRLRLNQWTEQANRWLDIADWDACPVVSDLEQYVGAACYAGLDLSSVRDLTALALWFPGDVPFARVKYYMPEDNIKRRVDDDGVPYDVWARDGWITTTPGNVVDQEFVKHDLQKEAETYHVLEVALDRWNSTKIGTELTDDGLEVVLFGQGFASMSAPSKDFETMVVGHKLANDGSPVTRWCVGNVAVKEDPAGNIKPDKSKSTEKIDGVVAMLMAEGRANFKEGGKARSVYEDRGMLFLD